MSIIRKHIPRQSDIDKIVRNIETRIIHSLELPIQAQDLIKAYQHSTHFHDIYQYITDGKLPSGTKVQNCIKAKALNYVVINHGSSKCERQIRTISEIIIKHLWDKGQMWPLFTTTAAYTMNTFALEALSSLSPFQLVFLRDPPD